jgi:hypothetical protein
LVVLEAAQVACVKGSVLMATEAACAGSTENTKRPAVATIVARAPAKAFIWRLRAGAVIRSDIPLYLLCPAAVLSPSGPSDRQIV